MTDPRPLLVGTAVGAEELAGDADLRALLARNARVITPENELKFVRVHPEPDRYDFAPADAVVAFAEQHGAQLRGHTLAWHNQLPEWVADAPVAARRDILREHIQAVVGRYRGRIAQWDVVNEPLDDDARFRESPWYEAMGPGYIADAFRWAHEADPDAALYLNDYNVEDVCEKSDAYEALIRALRADDVPIHGFGVQGHRIAGDPPTSMSANLQRFAALGLDVALTEVDVRLRLPADDESRRIQQRDFTALFDAAMSEPACTAFVVWGISDRYSWIPETFPGFGEAAPADSDLRPKTAFTEIFGQPAGDPVGAPLGSEERP